MSESKDRPYDEHVPCGRRDELCLNPSQEELGQLLSDASMNPVRADRCRSNAKDSQ